MAKPPLDGTRVLVTRPGCYAADKWGLALAKAGATVLAYPTIQVVPPPSWEPLDQALKELARYDWIVFTSASAVRFVLSRLPGGQLASEKLRVAAVGSETSQALQKVGIRVDLVPAEQRQEGLATAFAALIWKPWEGFHTFPRFGSTGQSPAQPSRLGPGMQVLLPRALEGQEILVESLRRQGCRVDLVPAYQTVPVDPLPALPAFDVATFASPSALRSFVRQQGTQALAGRTVAVIGPTTADEATRHGLSPLIAAQPNIDALISAIVRERSPQGGS
jgi:uroporphyrinogen III methyltransferase / synthase